MAENTRRKWIIAVVAIVLIVALIVLLSSRGHAPRVQVANVARQDLISAIVSNGKVEPVSPATSRAEFPTFVTDVKATEGQAVRRGQVILTLDDADIRAQLSQARADLLIAQTDLKNGHMGGPPDEVAQLQGDLAKAQTQVANLERTQQSLKDLLAKQAATQDEVAQNDAALATARANLLTLQQKKSALGQRTSVSVESAGLRVAQARDQVASLERKVQSATVIAATNGTLYSLPVRKSDFVKVGDVLAEMADLSQVRVRAFVDEPDLGSLAENQDVQVKWDARPNQTWNGKVEQVPKQVVPRGARSVGEVLCSINNDKLELLPNINVEVRILVHELHQVLVIPRGAVNADAAGHFVWVYKDGVVNRRNITIGIASASNYQVVSGLNLGDQVVDRTEDEMRDGMKVRASEAK
ncbi:MAG TPA: efflux RND transporter periplasmic adaptor subunit [Candidatus Acidoferrales bacterium]